MQIYKVATVSTDSAVFVATLPLTLPDPVFGAESNHKKRKQKVHKFL